MVEEFKESMRPTYENVYIGMFIFTLGYLFREKADGKVPVPVAIELYQQAGKADTLIGDLLAGINGKSIIVEFKRNAADLKKEIAKPNKRELLKKLRHMKQQGQERGVPFRLSEVSKRCHFAAFAGNLGADAKHGLTFIHYTDMVSADPKKSTGYAMADFSSRYLEPENKEIGASYEDLSFYVSALAKIGEGTCGGAIFCIDENGIQALVVFDDIRQLEQALRQSKELTINKVTNEKAVEQERSLAPKTRGSRSPGKGHDR